MRGAAVRTMTGMLGLLCAAIVLSVRPAPSQTAPSASIDGIILKFGTNEPLSKATVELQGGAPLTTTTEADGRFYFPDIPPGQYRLQVRRDGYWAAEYGQRWLDGPGQPITLNPGARAQNLSIPMTQAGVISGRITNAYGQPLAGARVRAMKPWVQENQYSLRVVQEVVANDIGDYRLIWLKPGTYYLSATFVDFPAGANLTINPDAPIQDPNISRSAGRPVTTRPVGSGIAEDEVYAAVYYPTTPDSQRALPINLEAGVDYRGADIRVSPTRTYHVRGVVTNPPPPQTAPGRAGGAAPARGGAAPQGGPPAPGGGRGTPVRLTPVMPNGTVYSANADGSTGQFDFPKVLPGGYVAYLFIDGMTIRAPVEVRSGDVDGVFLPVSTGVEIPVNFSLAGEPPPNLPDLTGLRATLWRDPTLINAPAMPAQAGGSALLHNIAPGDYRVYVPPILAPLTGNNPVNQPPAWRGAYVRSIRLGAEDVLSGGLHFNRQPEEPLEIVIGVNPAVIEGQVLDDRGAPVPSVLVTLLAEEPGTRIYRTDMYKVVATDTAGRFRVEGVPPGSYKVFAWGGVERGAWMDVNFVRPYESQGVSMKVEEGTGYRVDLPLIVPR